MYRRLRLITESAGHHEPSWESKNQRSQSLTPHIVDLYGELGFAPEFCAILGRHISDINILHYSSNLSHAQLTVASHRETDQPDNVVWHRELVISKDQYYKYKKRLTDASQQIDFYIDEDVIQQLVEDWLIFEASADAAANSCYMQHKFGRYVPDYNGQSPYYRSELSISRNFFETFGYDDEPSLSAIESDHADLRSGLALILLRDHILRLNASDNVRKSNWLINSLHKEYIDDGMLPLAEYNIAKRLDSVKVYDTQASLASFAMGIDFLDDEDEV